MSPPYRGMSRGHGDVVHVLLIEDNPGDARLAEAYLQENPASLTARVEWVDSLEKGKKALEDNGPFDVVLVDLSLPDSNGIETFSLIHEKAANLPIIVLSGEEDEELATEIVKLGGQECLAKNLMSGALMRRSIRHAIERKQIHEELRATQMQLIQAEKMESVGRLAAGVAHEVKNPLARILMGIEYLSTGIDPDDPNIPSVLEKMQSSVHRADSIIRGLLDFASERQLSLRPGDLNALVEHSLLLVEHELASRRVQVKRQFTSGAALVSFDEGKLEQVIINIILNAVQAMEQSERPPVLTLSTRHAIFRGVERDEGARSAGHLREGDAVVELEITDSGSGIPSEKLGQIFDPFFTTKPTGVGTGLGLTVVRKIIDLHQGHISIVNRDEGGARVTIRLRASN